MSRRVGKAGRAGAEVMSSPRGASRIATPQPAARQQARQLPAINWTLLARLFYGLLALALLGAAVQAWRELAPQLDRPIAQVLVESKLGAVAQSNQLELQQQLDSFGEVRFLSADLSAMQQALEQLPWIDQARVSRIWPDQLKVEVVEQQPIARWGEQQWLNSRGQVFRGVTREPEAGMPRLLGPEGSQEQVMQQYWSLTRVLRPMGYSIARLEMKARGSWFVITSDGLELLLGRDVILEKVRRFSAIYERELKEQMDRVARVDLRYANGLAVAWRDNDSAVEVQ